MSAVAKPVAYPVLSVIQEAKVDNSGAYSSVCDVSIVLEDVSLKEPVQAKRRIMQFHKREVICYEHTIETDTKDIMFTDFPRHQELWKHIQSSLAFEKDLAHDTLHIQRVYQWARRIAVSIGVDEDLAGATALIHDIVNIPKESQLRSEGSILSAKMGADILPQVGYHSDEVLEIVEAVRTCSWSRGLEPTSLLGQVLQDADRLDAIGAIGVARNIACAQAMRSRGNEGAFYSAEDPLGVHGRTYNDKQYAIDHYEVKLLRLIDGFHSDIAKKEAQRRHTFLRLFLKQLYQDII